ncbi:MAG: hypothetical protein V7K35_27565 [Nostoc sp.]
MAISHSGEVSSTPLLYLASMTRSGYSTRTPKANRQGMRIAIAA